MFLSFSCTGGTEVSEDWSKADKYGLLEAIPPQGHCRIALMGEKVCLL